MAKPNFLSSSKQGRKKVYASFKKLREGEGMSEGGSGEEGKRGRGYEGMRG